MATMFSDALRDLQRSLREYRSGKLSLPDLQAAVWRAAEAVQSYEERELRKLLEWAEGKLDMIRFTTGSADVLDKSLEVVGILEDKVSEALAE